MIGKNTLVGMMALAGIAVALLVYFFTGSIKWALGIGGVCFAIDLTFEPWIRKKTKEMERGERNGE